MNQLLFSKKLFKIIRITNNFISTFIIIVLTLKDKFKSEIKL